MPQFPNLSQTEFWNKTADELLQQLHTSEKGLTDADAVERLKQYGANTLKKKSNSSAAFLFLLQFKSPLTLLLLVAAILSVFLGDRTDAIIIFTIVFISSFLGFWQEKGAANAVSKLLKMVQIHCSVLRNGTKIEIPVENIVPGDVVELTAGDVVPGDGLILQSKELYMDEAAFTGETYPVEKMAGVVVNDAPLAKRTNSVLMGSHVISGTAVVLIAATGKQTEFGKISSRLSGKTPETDFEHGIRRFGYMLMEITLLLVMIIFAANVILEKPILDSLLFSLALAVGLTP